MGDTQFERVGLVGRKHTSGVGKHKCRNDATSGTSGR